MTVTVVKTFHVVGLTLHRNQSINQSINQSVVNLYNNGAVVHRQVTSQTRNGLDNTSFKFLPSLHTFCIPVIQNEVTLACSCHNVCRLLSFGVGNKHACHWYAQHIRRDLSVF